MNKIKLFTTIILAVLISTTVFAEDSYYFDPDYYDYEDEYADYVEDDYVEDDLDYPEEYYNDDYEEIEYDSTYESEENLTDAEAEESFYYEENKEYIQEDEEYISEENIDPVQSAEAEETWVDIDISSQLVSVYSGINKLLVSCCVTGLAGIMDTPVGTWHILNKELYATLVGADYMCPVGFWMPFTESGCGIHDATWRGDFSSDAYLYNGSHGCVNVGYDTASQIYDLVDCGTAVVVHY